MVLLVSRSLTKRDNGEDVHVNTCKNVIIKRFAYDKSSFPVCENPISTVLPSFLKGLLFVIISLLSIFTVRMLAVAACARSGVTLAATGENWGQLGQPARSAKCERTRESAKAGRTPCDSVQTGAWSRNLPQIFHRILSKYFHITSSLHSW